MASLPGCDDPRVDRVVVVDDDEERARKLQQEKLEANFSKFYSHLITSSRRVWIDGEVSLMNNSSAPVVADVLLSSSSSSSSPATNSGHSTASYPMRWRHRRPSGSSSNNSNSTPLSESQQRGRRERPYDSPRRRSAIDDHVNALWPSLPRRCQHPWKHLMPTSLNDLKYLSFKSHGWLSDYFAHCLTAEQRTEIRRWFVTMQHKPWHRYCTTGGTPPSNSTSVTATAPVFLYKQFLIYSRLNSCQQHVFDRLFQAGTTGQVMCLDANPGTGKTFTIAALSQVLHPHFATLYIVYTRNLSFDLGDIKTIQSMTCCRFLMRCLRASFSTVCNLWNLKTATGLELLRDDDDDDTVGHTKLHAGRSMDEHSFLINTFSLFQTIQAICRDLQHSAVRLIILDEYTVVSPWLILALICVSSIHRVGVLFIGDQYQQNSMSRSVHHAFNNYVLLRTLLPADNLLTLSTGMRQRDDTSFQQKIQFITRILQSNSRDNDLKLTYDIKYAIFLLFLDNFALPEDFQALFLAQHHRTIKKRLYRWNASLRTPAPVLPAAEHSDAHKVDDMDVPTTVHHATPTTTTTPPPLSPVALKPHLLTYRFTRNVYALDSGDVSSSPSPTSDGDLFVVDDNGGVDQNDDDDNNNDAAATPQSSSSVKPISVLFDHETDIVYNIEYIETVFKYPVNLFLVPNTRYIYFNSHGQQQTVIFERLITSKHQPPFIQVQDPSTARRFYVNRVPVDDRNHQTEHLKWLLRQVRDYDANRVTAVIRRRRRIQQQQQQQQQPQTSGQRKRPRVPTRFSVSYTLYQFPLRMYATTYHGAQGLTLDVPRIELSLDALTVNSIYVGLTRIRSEQQLGKLHTDSLLDFYVTHHFDDEFYYRVHRTTYERYADQIKERLHLTGPLRRRQLFTATAQPLRLGAEHTDMLARTAIPTTVFRETKSVMQFMARKNANIRIRRTMFAEKWGSLPEFGSVGTIATTTTTTAAAESPPVVVDNDKTTLLVKLATILKSHPNLVTDSAEQFLTYVVPFLDTLYAQYNRDRRRRDEAHLLAEPT